MTATTAPRTDTLAAEALFAASLRCGSVPTGAAALEAIRVQSDAADEVAIAAIVADEYGHHPDVAFLRMRRVLDALGALAASGSV